MINHPLHRILAAAGALPFIFCAIAELFNVPASDVITSYDYVAAVYAVVIGSFLAGAHWGTYLYKADTLSFNLLVTSNIAAIALWAALALGSVSLTLIVALVVFSALLVIDYDLFKQKTLTKNYFQTRLVVTAVVLLTLTILLVV